MTFNLRYHIPINIVCPAVSISYLAMSVQNLLTLTPSLEGTSGT